MIKKEIVFTAVFLLVFLPLPEIKAQDTKTDLVVMIGKDTANTDYLKGEAGRLRENCQSLKTKALELVTLYKGYVERTKECKGALEEAKLALDMANKALKAGDEGIKLADLAEGAKKMKDAKKSLSQIDPKIRSGHEYLKESEDRKKEIEFELKGC
jgi:hypothetical protein